MNGFGYGVVSILDKGNHSIKDFCRVKLKIYVNIRWHFKGSRTTDSARKKKQRRTFIHGIFYSTNPTNILWSWERKD